MALFFSFVSGYVNGLGLLVLGDVFLSFMSGNSTRLGIQLAKGDMGAMFKYGSVLVAFIAGAFIGDLLVSVIKKERLLVIVGAEIILLCLTLLLLQSRPVSWVTFLPLTVAMGVQNHAQITVKDTVLGKSYVSGQLFALGVALSKACQGKQYWSQSLICGLGWLFFIVGGSAGTLLVIAAGTTNAVLFLIAVLGGLLFWLFALEFMESRVLAA